MTEDELEVAVQYDEHISEFRFVYWMGDGRALSYVVRRDREHRTRKWSIFEGDWLAWADGKWQEMGPRPEAFVYELKDALRTAERLAYEENQRIIGVMEGRFPGQFKGGPFDLAKETVDGPHR